MGRWFGLRRECRERHCDAFLHHGFNRWASLMSSTMMLEIQDGPPAPTGPIEGLMEVWQSPPRLPIQTTDDVEAAAGDVDQPSSAQNHDLAAFHERRRGRVALSAWPTSQQRVWQNTAGDEFSQNRPTVGGRTQLRFPQPCSITVGGKPERNLTVHHAGKHFCLNFKRNAVQHQRLDGVSPKSPVSRTNIAGVHAVQGRSKPR